MIEGRPRSATVQAVEDTEMLFLARRDFEAFAREHPQVDRPVSNVDLIGENVCHLRVQGVR